MVYARLQRVLKSWQARGRILPQSSLGQAIRYALGQWASRAVYLQDGTIEIDNHLVENAIRPTAVGKKNWLFFGEAQAGQGSAVLYTIGDENLSALARGVLRLLARRADPFAAFNQSADERPHAQSPGQIQRRPSFQGRIVV